MRGIVACIVLSLAAVGVLGGSFYGEKENAIKAVNDKFKGLETVILNVTKHVMDQRQKTELETEEQVNNTLIDEGNKAIKELLVEAMNVTEIAMARGKSLSTIECILYVGLEGFISMIKTMEDTVMAVGNIKEEKHMALSLAELQINLIKTVSTLVKDKTLKKIANATSGFQALQADAVKKMDGAKKQLDELDTKIRKIDIKSEFLAELRKIAPKIKESIAPYLKKFQQCL